MSMSTYIIGIRPPDGKWKAMKAVWDACTAAGIDPPDEVADFFESDFGDEPDAQGIRIALEDDPCVSEYSSDAASGYTVELAKVPEKVTHLRFYNSW